MYSYKRIMVALDQTAMDKALIQYTGFMSKLTRPDKIYFVHVAPDLDVPDSLKEEFPQFKQPLDEAIEAEMRETVEKQFSFPGSIQIDYDAIEGNPVEQLLHFADIKDIDLLVVGGKKEADGSGVLAQMISRKIRASVLFVPDMEIHDLRTVLVPVDFSEYSKLAVEEAINLAEQKKDLKVVCQYIYQVPPQYYKTGKSYEEFATIMEGHAERRYERFIQEIDLKGHVVPHVLSLQNDDKPYQLILKEAKNQNADLIIVGAKGRTAASALLLGSMTEKLIRHSPDVPMLVVKDKEHTFNWLEVIKSI